MYYDARLDCWVFVEMDGILPDSVNGLVTVDVDGTYIMLINNNLSVKAKEDTFLHESKHIKRNDLYNPLLTATEIERNT